MSNKKLRITPLGGLGEVGKNMILYEYGANILVVDTGIMFPENDMLGIDYIIPDFNYLLEKRDQVRGIVITHGHEDHTGAIRHVIDEIQAPIFATPLTLMLVPSPEPADVEIESVSDQRVDQWTQAGHRNC